MQQNDPWVGPRPASPCTDSGLPTPSPSAHGFPSASEQAADHSEKCKKCKTHACTWRQGHCEAAPDAPQGFGQAAVTQAKARQSWGIRIKTKPRNRRINSLRQPPSAVQGQCAIDLCLVQSFYHLIVSPWFYQAPQYSHSCVKLPVYPPTTRKRSRAFFSKPRDYTELAAFIERFFSRDGPGMTH